MGRKILEPRICATVVNSDLLNLGEKCDIIHQPIAIIGTIQGTEVKNSAAGPSHPITLNPQAPPQMHLINHAGIPTFKHRKAHKTWTRKALEKHATCYND